MIIKTLTHPQLAVLLFMLSSTLSPKPALAEDDFGFAHGMVTYVAGEILEDINQKIFPPEVAKWVTNLEVAAIAYNYCNKEAKARDTWNMLHWNDDSFLDCAVPAVVASNKIMIGDSSILVKLIDVQW